MDGITGEIRMFAGNFAPRNWAFCSGALLDIAQNTALFSIIGTIYGGDGRTTFKLPDFRGRAATQQGSGPGLTPHQIGQPYGSETTVMNISHLPSHTHIGEATYLGQADGANGTTSNPTNAYLAKAHNNSGELKIYDIDFDAHDRFDMGEETVVFGKNVDNTGGNNPIDIMGPSLAVNYIICLTGTYPTRD